MDAVLITKEREIEVTQRALSGAQQQLEKQAEEYTVLEHKLEGTAEQLHSLQVSNQKLQVYILCCILQDANSVWAILIKTCHFKLVSLYIDTVGCCSGKDPETGSKHRHYSNDKYVLSCPFR